MYAEILIPQKIGDKETLTYALPPELSGQKQLEPGTIVEIPLRNKKIKGVVFKIHATKPPYAVKPLVGIAANAPHLAPWQITLMQWIADTYFCPLHRALKLFLPVPFVKKKTLKLHLPSEKTATVLQSRHTLTQEQKNALKIMAETTKRVTLLHGITGSGKTEIYMQLADEQIQKGRQALLLVPEISLTPQTVARFEKYFDHKVAIIHSQQTQKQKEKAWMSIFSGEAKVVIGSRSALFAPFQNLGVILLDEEHDSSYKQDQSPRYLGLEVAEKMAELLNVRVVAGSATPTLETFYKAENGEYELCTMSTRPGHQGAEGGNFGELSSTNIASRQNSGLPATHIVDLREEMKKGNRSIFSELLQQKLAKILQSGQQAMLFLNRRGAASGVICRMCGHVQQCKNCEVPMTYHTKIQTDEYTHHFTGSTPSWQGQKLICHHCGVMEPPPTLCPVCQSPAIRYIGVGTQRVEDEVKKLFPSARVLRADRDTIKKRGDFQEMYDAMKSHRADILIGTQMIAFGLHLPKVNLVGVILADMGLTIPNYRSSETVFQLIMQVGGRAGRAAPTSSKNLSSPQNSSSPLHASPSSSQPSSRGEVVIQTYMPDAPAIRAAALHDYRAFYDQELAMRKELSYPPFSRFIKLTVSDPSYAKCHQQAEDIMAALQKTVDQLSPASENPPPSPSPLYQLNSYPALIPRLKNKYRWHVLINGPHPETVLKKALSASPLTANNPAKAVETFQNIAIDINPLSTV